LLPGYVSGVPEPAIAFGDIIQSNGGTGSGSSSFSATLPGAITAGSLVVIMVTANNVPSGANSGWTKSAGMSPVANTQGMLWWFLATGGDTVPTITFAGASTYAWRLVEYAGPFDASPYEMSDGAATGGAISTIASSSITPTAGLDYLLVAGLGGQDGGGAWNVASVTLGSFTNSFGNASQQFRQASSEGQIACQVSRVVTGASGSYSTAGTPSTLTISGSSSRVGMTIAFKAVASGATAASQTLTVSVDQVTVSVLATTTPPAYRSHSSVSYASHSSTVLTAPSGLADNDILLAFIAVGSGGTPGIATPPAGFQELRIYSWVSHTGFTVNLQVFWKRAASESGSYTFTHATFNTQGVLLAYSGAATTGNPIDINVSFGKGVGTTSTALSITTTVDNTLLVVAGQNWDIDGASPPTGFTERFDNLLTIFDGAAQTTAGATGDKTFSPNGSIGSNAWQAWMLAIKPDGAPDTPSFRSFSPLAFGSHTSPSVIPAPPSIVDGDILIAALNITTPSGGTQSDITPPSGFTAVATATEVLSGVYVKQHVWWKRASSESGSYSFPHDGGTTRSTSGAITVYPGCISSGSPIDTYSTNNGTGSTATALSVTTTAANDILVIAGHNFDALEVTTPVGFTTRNFGISVLHDGIQVAAGASGDKVYTSGSGTAPWQAWLIALLAEPVAGDVDVDVTTNVATTAVDQVTVQAKATTSPTTNVATTSVGQATVSAKANVSATTNLLSTAVDQVTVDTGSAGVDVNVASQTLTASVDAVTASGAANVTTTTNLLTASVDQVTVQGKASATFTLGVISVFVSGVTVQAKANVSPTTNLLTASVDAATATAGATASVTTNLLTINVGQVTVTGVANVQATTNLLSVSVGQVTVEDDGGVVIPVYARRKQMLSSPPRFMGN
jgi:hypothetical protein